MQAWLLALVPSMLLSAAVNILLPGAEPPPLPTELGPGFFALLVLAAPFLETLLMAPPLLLLRRLFGPAAAVLASAVLWGLIHASVAPAWGLVTWWPFLILSVAFLNWGRRGWLTAVAIVTAIHALQNGVGALLLLTMPNAS